MRKEDEDQQAHTFAGCPADRSSEATRTRSNRRALPYVLSTSATTRPMMATSIAFVAKPSVK